MITIDFVDDNYRRSTTLVIQTMPVVKNGVAGGFDVVYGTTQGRYQALPPIAGGEQPASQVNVPRDRGVVDLLNRIARALNAWL